MATSPIVVWYEGHRIGRFRADLLIDDAVVLELKAAKGIEAAHEAQLLNVLKATTIEIGLLFNFGPKPQFRRLVYSNTRKRICVHLRSSAAISPLRGE